MNSTASQSSSSGCDGGSHWMPRSSLVATMPVPKYACQTRLTSDRAVVGDSRSTSQFANVSRSRLGAGGKRVQERGTPGVDGLARLEEIAALQHVRRPRLVALAEHQLRRALRMLSLQSASIRSLASFHSGTVVRQ